MNTSVWFWKELYPLLLRFCRERGLGFNEVINRAVEAFLSSADIGELRLRAEISKLLHEEAELRRVSTAMLRSGSYLPSYVQGVLREPGRPVSLVRTGQVPLKALNPKEEVVFRKIASRREQIAARLAEVQLELLKEVKPFRLKPEPRRSRSRARDKN
jgi:hypothetical protein